MLKIIMDSREAHKYLNGKRFVEFPNSYFDRIKEQKWFDNELVINIINSIDNAEVIKGFAVISNDTGNGYSVNDLSGGSKLLILTLMERDNIYLATMGDNCTDFLEQITLEYEKEGKDLIIVSNYFHSFNFKYIREIHYVNWNITCRSWNEVCDRVAPLYLKDSKNKLREVEEG